MHELTKYDEARNALAICASIDEVKDVHDKSEAMRQYARMSENTELEVYASTIKLRAQVKLGEMIAAMETFSGVKVPTGGTFTKKETLDAAKISKSAAHRYEKLAAAMPEPVLESFIVKANETQRPVSMPKAMAFIAPPKPKASPAPLPPVAEPETVTITKHEYEELHSVIEEYKTESEATAAVFDADDKVSEAVDEIRKLTAKVALLETQKTGLQNQANELKRSSVSKDRQIAKLTKELDGYKLAAVGL